MAKTPAKKKPAEKKAPKKTPAKKAPGKKKKPAEKKPAKKKPAKKSPAKKTVKSNDLSVYILLDRSGSMESMWDEALSSINLYVSQLDDSTKATLAAFDSESYDILRDTTVADWKKVTRADAAPRSCTPLYDSAGKMLTQMEKDNPKSAVFVVMTDGYENASHEFNQQDIIDKIKHVEKNKGWQVIFLGANFSDIKTVSSQLGVGATRNLNITPGNMRGLVSTMAAYTSSYGSTGKSINFTAQDVQAASGGTTTLKKKQ